MHEVATHAPQQVFQNKIYYYYNKFCSWEIWNKQRIIKLECIWKFLPVVCIVGTIVDMKAQNVPRHVEISIHWHVETFRSQINQLFVTQLLPKFAFATEFQRQDRPWYKIAAQIIVTRA